MNNPASEPTPPIDSRKLLFLIGQKLDESFENFKAKVIQHLKDRGIFKSDGSSNLNRDGSFIVPPTSKQNKQPNQNKI